MADSIRGPLHNTSSPREHEPKPHPQNGKPENGKPGQKEKEDVDKLLKWQQDRIERKLRGEYESAVLHLGEVITSNLNTPVTLSAVRIEGATNTRKSFLKAIVDPVTSGSAFSSTSGNTPDATPSGANSTSGAGSDILHATRSISHSLRKTDIFSSVEAYIDRPKDPLSSRIEENGEIVDLVFKTKEKGRFFVSSSTELGNSEGSANLTTRIRNILGGAETFEASLSLGTKTRRSFKSSLSFPLTPSMDTLGMVEAYAQERDLTTYASCWEGVKGVKAFVRRGEVDKGGMHELGWEGVRRSLGGLEGGASISMREQSGSSFKSSLSHTFMYDTRDDRIAAKKGGYVKTGLGAIGLGGDAKFYKIEVEGQVSRGLWESGSVSLAARSGLLWGLGRRKPTTLFSDRFQLGGPTSVRGFKANGMGPRDGNDSIGGQIYYSAGMSVISDVPTKRHWPVKMHGWVNAGRLDGVDQTLPLSQTLAQTLSKPSISAGVGMIYRFDPVRLEVNFGVPVVSSRSDRGSRGVQVGMGLEFM
ncbi:surface antigen-domain-containing protein [Crepidotus variabilis]|uniref:Surface antigen-domain-containing protein n=1 Tax=Crepidotus variabilis TaxID=179855 RepID=A0A9P6JHX6_9AGAR|nr:surface antigen-domain-containing protein [Crepidotus variabilis]